MRDDTVEVVRLGAEDWFAYKELRLEALKQEPQAFGSDYASNAQKPDSYWRGRLEEAVANNGSWLLFARKQSALVGMIGAFVEDDPSTADIISVYVTPAERERGIGTLLMDSLLQALHRNTSLKSVRLTVNKDQSAAIWLYTRLGFQIIGEEQAHMGDGNLHEEYVMARLLRL